jgi:hypothetical protein
MGVEGDEALGDARLLDIIEQGLAALRPCMISAGTREQGFEIAAFP